MGSKKGKSLYKPPKCGSSSNGPQTHGLSQSGSQATKGQEHDLGFASGEGCHLCLDETKPLRIKTSDSLPANQDAPSMSEAVTAFETKNGKIICGDSCIYMANYVNDESIDLVLTSPPFGLVRKKAYGNEDADLYVKWFEQFADQFVRILRPAGSLVIDIGGSWKRGTLS